MSKLSNEIIESTIEFLYDLDDDRYAKIVVPESYSGEYDYEKDIDCVLRVSRTNQIDILEYNNNKLDLTINGEINESNIIRFIYENW